MLSLYRYLIILLLLAAIPAKASHIYGGDLLYKHLGGGYYKLTLTLYGDCSADYVTFNQLFHAQPKISIQNGSSILNDTFALSIETGSGVEVSPVCPSMLNQTYCNGGTLPGVIEFRYSRVIQLPPSAYWRFKFKAQLGYNSSGGGPFSAGRSSSITNVHAGTFMQLEASLNNLNGENSSPAYTSIPTPFYCINVPQQYNQGATDADGDSLVFSLAAAKDAQTDADVNYNFPFTATAPLATASGGFAFNSYNGQTTFTPNTVQNALIVNQVKEYRNGTLVGITAREMTFIVQDNCSGTPPTPTVTAVNGAVVSNSGNVINLCVGQPFVSFNITMTNPDADNLTLTATDAPPGAALSIANNNSPTASVVFNWNTAGLNIGHYTFYLTINNNRCPISSIQTVAYTINISSIPVLSAHQLTPTNCINPAAVQFDVQYGFPPRNIKVYSGGSLVKTIADTNTTDSIAVAIIDSLPSGTYTAVVVSDALCTDTTMITITDSGKLILPTITHSYCPGDAALPITAPVVAPGAVINWYTADSIAMSGPPMVNTYSEGVYNWYFIESYNVCTSGPVPVTAVVHGKPDAQILNVPQTVCYGDDIYLQASGGVEYTWAPEDIIKHDSGYYVEVLLPVTVVVKVKDQYGCLDTASVTYNNIQQCCRFSYPTAFTPNNDGNNDGFRIVTWGNMKTYALTIYNRWGQRVFFTANPDKAWDGTFGGQPCETGTYYYYLDAQCLTGPKEWHKGDVTLVR